MYGIYIKCQSQKESIYANVTARYLMLDNLKFEFADCQFYKQLCFRKVRFGLI